MLTPENYRLAKIAYDAYVLQANGVSFITGDRLPEFAMLAGAIKRNWVAAALAIQALCNK